MLIFNGKFAGLSDSKWSGTAGSFATCVGIDGHSSPGILKIRQMLEKESAAVVTEFCKVKLAVSNGINLWFSSTSGKVWAESSGTYVLVTTLTATAGAAICLGAEEFDGYIYMATQSRLHRIALASATITPADWTGGIALNWANFTITDSSWHPMVIQGQRLFIGDGTYVAKVSETPHAFTAEALDLKSVFKIKTMAVYDIDILIGPTVTNNVNKVELIRWDTESPTWTSTDPIEEDGINSFIRDDNYLYVNAGQAGNLYYYNGSQLVSYKRVPGTYSPTKTAEIYPNASATLLGVPVFGLSNGSGNPTLEGVYSFGSYGLAYDKVIDLSYPISAGLSGVKIGAIIVRGMNMWVSWTDGTNKGVDKLNWSKKYTSAYIETTMINLDEKSRDIIKSVANASAHYALLPEDTAVSFYFKKYSDDSWSDEYESVDDSILRKVSSDKTIPNIANLQVKIAFTVATNDAPEIELISINSGLDDPT